jgi:hypothetical protein
VSEHRLIGAIAQHDQMIQRASTMIAAGSAGLPLPPSAQFHPEECKNFDSEMLGIIIDTTANLPSTSAWTKPSSFAFANEPRGDNREPFGWLKAYRAGLEISKRYFEVLLASHYAKKGGMRGSVHVTNAQVVVLDSTTGDIKADGNLIGGSYVSIDMAQLSRELGVLRAAMRQAASEPDHDIALGAIAEAEKLASAGNAKGALARLKGVGKWCLDVATKIGVSVAAKAIESQIGIDKGAA